MIGITWYLIKDTIFLYYLLVRKNLKTITILVYTNLVLGDIGRFELKV